MLDAAPRTAILLRLNARDGTSRVGPLATGLHLIDKVTSTTTTNVVDGGLLAAKALLSLELFVEGEHGALGLLHVTGTATTNGVDGVGGWWAELDARGRASGSVASGDVGSLDAHGVTGASTAGVDVGGLDIGVGLGDVEGRHCVYVCVWVGL